LGPQLACAILDTQTVTQRTFRPTGASLYVDGRTQPPFPAPSPSPLSAALLQPSVAMAFAMFVGRKTRVCVAGRWDLRARKCRPARRPPMGSEFVRDILTPRRGSYVRREWWCGFWGRISSTTSCVVGFWVPRAQVRGNDP
jgi:hypothetical protein